MRKLFLIPGLLLLICNNLFCQNATQDFNIPLSKQKIESSLYKTIKFIDSRYDTTNMGVVESWLLKKRAMVIPAVPLAGQLSSVLSSLIDSTTKDGELLFQLRKLHFIEHTDAMSTTGFCYYRAVLYSKRNDSYKKLASIDTVIAENYGQVTKELLIFGGRAIESFIAANLTKEATGLTYSLSDITHLDSLEKQNIKVYADSQYTDGIYKTYESFKNQVPDKQISSVIMKKDEISFVKTIKDNGKEIRVFPTDIYAIVYQGHPYISMESEYYPLVKKNDDFFFTGRAEITANGGNVMAAQFFFGIIGAAVAAGTEAVFEMRLDYISGKPIRVREIKN
jgi:hypothetical protein